MERIQFANTSLALDIDANGVSGTGNAGIAVKVINALLGRSFVQDKGVVGIVLGLLDQGISYEQLVGIAVSHPAFSQLAGAGGGPVSATQLVNHVYKNVVGVLPDPDSLSVLSGYLTSGAMTQAQLGFIACETDINKAAVNLVGLSTTGVEYTPLPGV